MGSRVVWSHLKFAAQQPYTLVKYVYMNNSKVIAKVRGGFPLPINWASQVF